MGKGYENPIKLKDVSYENSGGLFYQLTGDMPIFKTSVRYLNAYFISLYGERTISPLMMNIVNIDKSSKIEGNKMYLSEAGSMILARQIEIRHLEFIEMARELATIEAEKLRDSVINTAENPTNTTTKITETTTDKNNSTNNGNSKNSRYGFDSTEAVPDTVGENSDTTEQTNNHDLTHTETRSGNDGHDSIQYIRSYVSYIMSNPYTKRFLDIVAQEVTNDLYIEED